MAFQKLVRMFDRQILSLICRYFPDQNLASDVYQDTFISAYKNINSFQFKSEFSTWLYRIAVNTSISTLRKERKHRHSDISELSIQSAEKDSKPLLDDIFSVAKKLPDQQRLVFIMRFQNDLKLSEIAEAMSVDLGTVKGYLFRALKKIRAELEIVK